MTGPDVPFIWPQDHTVLRSATAHVITDDFCTLEQLTADTGLTETEVDRSVRRLRDNGYLTANFYGGGDLDISTITGNGLTAAGAWPSPETLADRLLAAVEAGMANASTEDERSRWRKLRDGLASAGRDVVVGAAGGALGGLGN
jgi:hypothetical protein